MSSVSHRDQAFRAQPSLFDAPAAKPVPSPSIPIDQGKVSRDETYRDVKGDHHGDRMKWLCRIVAKGRAGATLDELSAEYGIAPNTFSGRFTELAGLGLVVRTGERRPTRSGSSAAVIVAVDFLKSESPVVSEVSNVIAPKEFMPGQLTQMSTPTDTKGRDIHPERTYMVSRRGSVGRRMRVFESDGEVFCQEVGPKGTPLDGSRPQRIDEMDSAASWLLI